MFEQAELQGTQMGPNGPPNAKGTAKIAPEIANSKKIGPFGSFWPFWPKRSFWSFWPAIFETGWPRRKKSHLGFCLDQRDRARCEIFPINLFTKTAKIFNVVGGYPRF